MARVERGEVGVEPFAAGARRVKVLTRLRSRGEGFFFFNESKKQGVFFCEKRGGSGEEGGRDGGDALVAPSS